MSNGRDWEWPGRFRHAVSLVFEGTTAAQCDFALPFLSATDLRATFYADPEPYLNQLSEWQGALAYGHEIGNGCLLTSSLPDGSLPLWNREMIAADIAQTEEMLDETLGAAMDRSFCFPIGVPECADGDYSDVVAKTYRTCRSSRMAINSPFNVDLRDIGWSNTRDVTDLLIQSKEPLWCTARVDDFDHAILEEAVEEWRAHAWIATVVEVSRFIRSIRKITDDFEDQQASR